MFQHCFIFSYLSGGRNSEEKRRGAFKSKREGYALFKASHVFDVKFNSSHDDFCFFDARVKASMTRIKIYRTKVWQNKTGEVISAQCTCKAGVVKLISPHGVFVYVLFVQSSSDIYDWQLITVLLRLYRMCFYDWVSCEYESSTKQVSIV